MKAWMKFKSIYLSFLCTTYLLFLCIACNGANNTAPLQADAALYDWDNKQADTVPPQRQVGEECTSNPQCLSNICFGGKCAKVCIEPKGCEANQVCGSDDGKRLFCYQPTYPKNIGTSCAVTGTCPLSSLKCLGGGENAYAYCSVECKNDTDCPPRFTCRQTSDQKKFCFVKNFCTPCHYDGQCEVNSRCIKQGSGNFCARTCTKGSTECPRFANCQDIGGGKYYCLHKAGTCVGDGKTCSPCKNDVDCESGGLCLTYVYTKESFCATKCGDNDTCSSNQYKCEEITRSENSKSKQCVPAAESRPSCVKELSPTMEKGDILDDFSMVGYVDQNHDGSLENEKPKLIKLSDFADQAKIILLNVAAGWCVPCQNETGKFPNFINTYAEKGLIIVQILFEPYDQSQKPTLSFLDDWIKRYQPAILACGIDPGDNSVPYNTQGTTPLNMIIEAKTRKVLEKFNGNQQIENYIQKQIDNL